MDPVIDACEQCFEANKGDCSAFVRAVAARLGIGLGGNANDIVAAISAGGDWQLVAGGVDAATAASAGEIVIAGMLGSDQTVKDPHGHVVVVVQGPLAHGLYPSAYWGSLGGTPGRDKTLNWAWTSSDRDRITYASMPIP